MENEKFLETLEDSFGDWFDGKFPTPKMSDSLYPYKAMFSPIRVNKLTLKNRLVMGPMGNISMAEETGRPNPKMLAYFEERAKGGVGLITTGLVPVSHGIDASITELGKLSYFPRIDRSRTVFSGWRDLAYACHSHGASIFIQLTAGLGRVGNPQCLVNSLKLPVSASWNPNYYIPQIPCRPLSDMAISKIVKRIGQGAADAKASNIDGVYLHGHEGYLMEQLTNPAFNRRKLGKYSNWQAFGIESVKKIRQRVGKNFPIMYRIDLSLALNATYGEKMMTIKALKKFRHERRIEETLDYMENLVKAGVDMFDVDLGCYDNWWLPHPPSSMPSGCFLAVSKLVKDYFKEKNILSNAGVEVPVVAVGKLGYPDLAESALRDGLCDMVMLARPLLADPEWPKKAYEGNTKAIRPCIGCQECIHEFVEGGHPQCAVNPRTSFEDDISILLQPAMKQKKIAIIGAGPSGCTAAEVLALRGHKVELFEKEPRIGGMLVPAGTPKIKYEIENYRQYLIGKIRELEKQSNFKLSLNTPVSLEMLKKANFDVIITATGTKQMKLPIDGIDKRCVKNVIEVLNDPTILDDAKDIVIIGGGDSGCELAYFLSYELGKNVRIVEMEPVLMKSACTANRGHILHYLEKAGVKVDNCTRVLSINEEHTVTIEKNISQSVPNPFNTWQPILPENINNPLAKKIHKQNIRKNVNADAVILACGTVPDDSLYYEIVKNNLAKEVYNIGDSLRPGKVFSATKYAYRKSTQI